MTAVVYVGRDDAGEEPSCLAASTPTLEVTPVPADTLETAAADELRSADCAVVTVDDVDTAVTDVARLRAAGFDGSVVLFGDAPHAVFAGLVETTGAATYVRQGLDTDGGEEAIRSAETREEVGERRADATESDRHRTERWDDVTWRRLGEAVERVVAVRGQTASARASAVDSDGADGADGTDGTDGAATDGTDGTATDGTDGTEHDRFRALFENTTDAVAYVTYEGSDPVVREVNAAFVQTFGSDGAESDIDGEGVEGAESDDGHASLEPFGDPRHTSATAAAFRRHVLDGEAFEREVRRRTRDGVRDFLLRGVPVDDTGTPRGYAVYTDITDRKRIERALGRLHETTRELVRADSDEVIADVTVDAASDILGYPVVTLRVYDPETGSLEVRGVSEATEAVLGPHATEGPAVGLAREAFKTGTVRVVTDLSAHDLGDPGVDCAMYLPLGERGLLTLASTEPDAFDAAERRLAQILAANVEVALDRAEWTRLLRERERELERQNTRLDEFASVVSHDLRNPLSVARGYFDLVCERCAVDDDPDLDDYAERVDRAHERMNRLITDLLSLAREGQTVGETEQVGLHDVARRAWNGVETGGATLELLDDRTLQADAERLNTLLENLFGNCIEHGSASRDARREANGREGDADRADDREGDADGVGGSLVVRVGSLEDGFYLEDNGPGIPASEREKVFTRGYSTGEHGTGFGLSIVEGISRAHGWNVTATAAELGGARFEVTGVDWPRRGDPA